MEVSTQKRVGNIIILLTFSFAYIIQGLLAFLDSIILGEISFSIVMFIGCFFYVFALTKIKKIKVFEKISWKVGFTFWITLSIFIISVFSINNSLILPSLLEICNIICIALFLLLHYILNVENKSLYRNSFFGFYQMNFQFILIILILDILNILMASKLNIIISFKYINNILIMFNDRFLFITLLFHAFLFYHNRILTSVFFSLAFYSLISLLFSFTLINLQPANLEIYRTILIVILQIILFLIMYIKSTGVSRRAS